MASSLEDFKARVLRVYKRTDKDTEMVEAINDAYAEMVAIIDPRKLADRVYRPITAGRAQWALPVGFLRINHPIKLIDPNGGSRGAGSFPLRFKTKEEYDELEPNPDASNPSTGTPWAYTIHKNSVWLTSIPDRAYTLEMSIGGEPTVLSGLSDEVIFSPTWDATLAAGACARLFTNTKQYKEAQVWQGVYENGWVAGVKGGINLLKEIERDNKTAAIIVKNNRL